MGLFGPPNIERLKAKGDVQGLIRALGYEKDIRVDKPAEHPCVSSQAIDALVSLGTCTVAPLIAALGNDQNSWRRMNAAEALGKIGDSSAAPPLIVALLKDDEPLVRGSAAGALGAIGDPLIIDVTPALEESGLVPTDTKAPLVVLALTKALEDQSVDVVRWRAAEALSEIPHSLAVEPLIAALQYGYDYGHDMLRWAVTRALGRIADPRAVKPLVGALKDKDRYVRVNAVAALGATGDSRAVEPLVAALKDADEDVRRDAATALGKIADPRAAESLAAILEDEKSREVQLAASFALGEMGDTRAVQSLAEVLKYGDILDRMRAVEMLRRIGDDQAVQALIHALKNSSHVEVRQDAAKFLGVIGGGHVVDSLIDALKDKHSGVRVFAAHALGRISDPRAVEPLIAALEDVPVRADAAVALGKIGDTRAVEALAVALADENTVVCRAAAEALEKIRAGHAVEPPASLTVASGKTARQEETGQPSTASAALAPTAPSGSVAAPASPLEAALQSAGADRLALYKTDRDRAFAWFRGQGFPAQDHTTPLGARWFLAMSGKADDSSLWQEAWAGYHFALAGFAEQGELAEVASILWRLGRALTGLRQYDLAAIYLDAARSLAQKLGDANLILNVNLERAVQASLARQSEAYEQAIQRATAALFPEGKASPEAAKAAFALFDAGRTNQQWRVDDAPVPACLAHACGFYTVSLELNHRLGDNQAVAFILFNLGDLWRDLGDNAQARQYWQQSLPLFQKLGDSTNAAMAQERLADSH